MTSANYKNVITGLVSGKSRLVSDMLNHRIPDFLVQHSRLLDTYFIESFVESAVGPHLDITKNPYAIVALGGYGRQEQCVHSDVDLLFLFKKGIPADAEALIREVLYPLWDIGMEVGHATRSIKECIQLAAQDYEVLTSLLDARFVCGVSPLYSELMELIRIRLMQRKGRKIVDWLVDTNIERHQRFGDSAYLLEPNLKEGQGGLRDYHTMLWIARIQSGLKQDRDLEYHGYLSHEEYQLFSEALAFIWDVRNRLHHMAGRKNDQLKFAFQEQIAEDLGYEARDGQQPVERFLGKLHGHMELLKQQHAVFLYELGHSRTRKRRRKVRKKTPVPGLSISPDGMLMFSSPEAIVDEPSLLIKIFEESARLKIPLGSEARRLIKEFLHLVDDAFRCNPENIYSFERILATPVPEFNVLNAMLNTGMLVALLPEFAAVVDRIQYDQYHLYPVDRHMLRALHILKHFGTPDSRANDPLIDTLYKETRHRKWLLWATLLHDIGKGEPGGGHSEKGVHIAEILLQRMGYRPKDIDTITFLIREHLALVKAATRRDINDEETAIVLARQIQSVERLKMLYLLTVADSIATGPKAWNDWTAALLQSLFLRVHNIIENGELATREAMEMAEQKRDLLLADVEDTEDREQIRRLFQFMSPRYLLYAPADDMKSHIQLYNELGDRDFVWQIDRSEKIGTRTVTVCAKDRPGLFSRIAGVFTLHGIDVLDAQVFTWRNNVALDIFEVHPPPDQIFEYERWGRAEKDLAEALAGRLDLSASLAEKISELRRVTPSVNRRPARVVVNNKASSFFTIIEVFADDFPGLLFSITDALFRCQLDVWVAKITTQVDQVLDVFYVRDFDGQKIDAPEQEDMIRAAVETVLAGNGRLPVAGHA